LFFLSKVQLHYKI